MGVFGLNPQEVLENSIQLQNDLRKKVKLEDFVRYQSVGISSESRNWKDGKIALKYPTYFVVENEKAGFRTCFSYDELDKTVFIK